MRKLAIIVLSVLLVSCAGTPFKWEDTAKVQNGMTEAEVTAILGKPYSRTQSGSDVILTWSFANTLGGARAVSYRLTDGRVVGARTVGQ